MFRAPERSEETRRLSLYFNEAYRFPDWPGIAN